MSGTLFDDYKAALRRGHLATIAGSHDDALEAYREAARLVPERALPVASQGIVLHRLDRWQDATEAFEQALQLAPDDEATLRARAAAREERGLRSGAAADFERLAFVLDVAGRATEAAEAARRSVELELTISRQALAARLVAAAPQRAAPGAPAMADAGGEPHLRGAAGDLDDDAPVGMSRRAFDDLPYASDESDDGDTLPGGAGERAVDGSDSGIDADTEAAFPGITEERLATAIAALDETPGIEAVVPGDGQGRWPGIDLPSPPPAPLVGPPPDPESLVAAADDALAIGDSATARDLLLTAARVHREAGRLDAALELSLQLLGIAPGDPQVHLALANLQLDRGWTGVATEKIELLVRLTSLTGDTQAEADVHGLASERLRDDPAPSPAAR
ncbi:MAG TPA: hypothetical protein VM451_03560 [Candidatus Limnocylindria bacterium]|nr:hypothetical protein [Candidatus Limnocylindria bacterium]